MQLGVQYYRPPFPNRRYWRRDFARIRACGLDAVQLWVLWSWVESRPGSFDFDDYDELADLARRNGLKVVLSTIAEIQPCWIHRLIPDGAMVDHMGRLVISSNRQESHHGLTPGGCTDHPQVWGRMRAFIDAVAARYAGLEHLHGWDAWNELRWNVNSDGLVCFCQHTIAAFHGWLKMLYGDLAGRNRAWKRRYGDWDEVKPGKLPGRTFTEMMAFQHFLTWRANEHARARAAVIRARDRLHPITVHGGNPTPLYCGHMRSDGEGDHALNRGNDWDFADALDGIGCSSFPKWSGIDDADFGMRIEFVKSAARSKRVWLSEIQGGRAAIGNSIFAPVDPQAQQRWIWNGLACGADTLLFWCWRDEVFGKESAGFGLAGDDGLAGARLAALEKTAQIFARHRRLLETYQPCRTEVGVLFSPQSYYQNWAMEGNAVRPMNALCGYLRALVRNSIPYRVVEEAHLGALAGLKILFLPRAIVSDASLEAALAAFVRGGGTLFAESECGAFDTNGTYRYPGDRFIARLSGVKEIGRRSLGRTSFEANVDGSKLQIGATQWRTPLQVRRGRGIAMAPCPEGSMLSEITCGRGRIVLCGTYAGEAYRAEWNAGFEALVTALVRRAGVRPAICVEEPVPQRDSFVYIKHGAAADGRRLVFVFFQTECEKVRLRFARGFWRGRAIRELIGGRGIELRTDRLGTTCAIGPGTIRIAVLAG